MILFKIVSQNLSGVLSLMNCFASWGSKFLLCSPSRQVNMAFAIALGFLVSVVIPNLCSFTSAPINFVSCAITGLFDEYFTNKTHKKWLVAVVALVVTVLNNTWIKGETVWQEYFSDFLLTWSFAVLAYSYLGLWVVKKLFDKIKEKLSWIS